jgi:hypothetical protein
MDEVDSLDDLDKMTLPDPAANYLKVPDKYKTPKDDGEKAFREQIAAPSSRADEAPESYEIPMPKVAPTRSSGRQVKKRTPVVEDPVDLPEIPEFPELPEVAEEVPADEEMMANITFSFNKKKAPMSGVDMPPVNNSIPRRTEEEPEEKLGMAIMNSEYDDGVLPYAEAHREEIADEPREIVPRQTTESENYFGSDVTNRPLAYRPPAPLAQRNDDVYVEKIEPHPEDDENNRPLAQRPPAPLARATEERGPSLEYLTEHEMDSEIRQMPSLESRGRWGEMPEAKETPSWAKPQHEEESDSPFRRPASTSPRGRSHMSRDELRQAGQEAARKASDAAASRPSARARTLEERKKENQAAYAFRPPVQQRPAQQVPEEEPEQEQQRPAWSRPSARPGTASRPAAREEAPKKNVPIWERVPETDGPIPAWGSSAAYVDDDRPRGSLMKPKGQIIDVEKPRERTGVGLWGADPSPKEVLLPGGATLGGRDEEETPREAPPRRPASRPAAERPAPRAATRPAARPAAERPAAERPATRPGRTVDVEVSAPRREAVNRSAEVTEDESAPITFSSDRPRTYAQRRQMEEEERRRQIQSPFAKQEQKAPLRRPPLRPAEMPRDEEDGGPVNRTFESAQFEDKPSVVASLDMLPEPLGEESIHHLAKDSSIPALARDKDEIQDELAQGERTARKAIRGLPEYDPDGPSPFKPNR